MTYQLYWGDLHAHCSVSYGEGSVEQALRRARQQLDFCSITGHAYWPDMPTDRDRYGEIIDYHTEGFDRLARNWDELLKKQAAGSQEGEFVVFPSFEWHSLQYGDHNVYAPGPGLDLRDAPDLRNLQQQAKRCSAVCIPHHIGYAPGFRGLDWRHFDEKASPFVEIFSLHGCSESDAAPYPMLHDMGPRNGPSTAVAGWSLGHKFGVIASTDHHGGYPGSYGDGRLAVLAEELSRDAIWQALLERRVYAVTGDKIDARLWVDDAEIGSVVPSGDRHHLRIQVQSSAALDRVELLKNDCVYRRFFPASTQPNERTDRYRLRVTWGWGRKDEPVRWLANLRLSEGAIREVETCFSGQSIVAPRGVAGHTDTSDQDDLPHEVLDRSERTVTWRSVTTGNRSTRHPTTQALSLDLEAPLTARLTVEANGHRIQTPLAALLRRGHAHYLRGWLSEAIQIGPLTPAADCCVAADLEVKPETNCDRYRLRVAQANGQWAWLSPIWIE